MHKIFTSKEILVCLLEKKFPHNHTSWHQAKYLQHSLDRCLSNSLSSNYRIHHLLTLFSARLENLFNFKSQPESSTWSLTTLISTLLKTTNFGHEYVWFFSLLSVDFGKSFWFLFGNSQAMNQDANKSKWSAFLERTDNENPSQQNQEYRAYSDKSIIWD